MPRICALYELPFTPSEVRHLVNVHFKENAGVTDPRVVQMLVAKGEMELDETVKQVRLLRACSMSVVCHFSSDASSAHRVAWNRGVVDVCCSILPLIGATLSVCGSLGTRSGSSDRTSWHSWRPRWLTHAREVSGAAVRSSRAAALHLLRSFSHTCSHCAVDLHLEPVDREDFVEQFLDGSLER